MCELGYGGREQSDEKLAYWCSHLGKPFYTIYEELQLRLLDI